MIVCGVLGTKGGAGKTTITSSLSVRAAMEYAVAVVDLDPQESYSQWYVRRGSPDNPMLFRGSDRASDAVETLTLNHPYDYLFLDGPPGSLLVTNDAVSASHLVVMPIRASGLDIGASQDLIGLCQEHRKPLLAVINDKGQHDGKLAENARAVLTSWGVTVAETVISHRTQYINAITSGRTGAEKDREARREIDALWAEVLAMIAQAVPA